VNISDDPVLDAAIAHATLERAAAGELSETVRLTRPGRAVTFGKRDSISPGFADAVRAARGAGFEAVIRLGGGRAAVFHEGTVSVAHAIPYDDPRPGIGERFEREADLLAGALRDLGVDARVGEVPGEYCPGGYSVNARGRVKLAGFGQRLIAGGAHVGTVIVVEGADLLREVLAPVYEALDLDWDPATAGAVGDEVPGIAVGDVIEALRGAYAVADAPADAETLALARRLSGEHRALP
jgi:octanoyl-[GcvH]:protein N-octanoyltransferase